MRPSTNIFGYLKSICDFAICEQHNNVVLLSLRLNLTGLFAFSLMFINEIVRKNESEFRQK